MDDRGPPANYQVKHCHYIHSELKDLMDNIIKVNLFLH